MGGELPLRDSHNSTFFGCAAADPHTCSSAVEKCKWCDFSDGQWFCADKDFDKGDPRLRCKKVKHEKEEPPL